MTQLHRHDLRHRGQGARTDLRTAVTGSRRMRVLHPTWMKSGSPSNEQSSWVSQVPTVGRPRRQQATFPNNRSCQTWSVSMLCGRPARPPTTALAPAAGPTARHACCCSRAIVLATLQSVHDHAMVFEAVQPPPTQLSPAQPCAHPASPAGGIPTAKIRCPAGATGKNKKVPYAGIEPATTGLKGPRSTN